MAIPRIIEEQRYRQSRATGSKVIPVVAADVNPIIDVVNGLTLGSSLSVTIAHSDGANTFVATATGGTSPYTYLWSKVSTGQMDAGTEPTFTASTSATYTYATQSGNPAMVRCIVTDANGIKADAYFLQMTPGA